MRIAALEAFPILGIRTNTPLLLELLSHPRFIAGAIDTQFLDAEGDALRARLTVEPPADALAVASRDRGDATRRADLGRTRSVGSAAGHAPVKVNATWRRPL